MRLARITLILLAVLAMVAPAAPPPVGVTFPAHLDRVVDGDTAIVSVTIQMRVRFDECYVPDKRPRINERAKQELKTYSEGKPCVVWLKGRDLTKLATSAILTPDLTLERFVGKIWLKDNSRDSLSEWQVRKGNASSTHDGKLGE